MVAFGITMPCYSDCVGHVLLWWTRLGYRYSAIPQKIVVQRYVISTNHQVIEKLYILPELLVRYLRRECTSDAERISGGNYQHLARETT